MTGWRFKRIVLIGSALVICAMVIALWYAAFGDSSRATAQEGRQNGRGGRPALVVEVQRAQRGDLTQHLHLSGEIIATQSVVIAATKEGPITFCPWREGDTVQAGDKLITIDRAVHRAEVEAAAASLAVARAHLADLEAGARSEQIAKAEATVARWRATVAEASKHYQRQQQLLAEDFTSQQRVDEARERVAVAEGELAAAQQELAMLRAGPTETELDVQRAEVEEAAAQLNLAQAHLDECVVVAPFDGVITAVHIRPGDLATPRDPLLEMYDPDSLVARFAVPESHAAAVGPGQPLSVRIDGLGGSSFSAKVTRVHPQLDPSLRTRTVEATLSQPPETMLPHMFARVALVVGHAQDAILIPTDAIVSGPEGEPGVFIAEQGKVQRHSVELGIEKAGTVEVREGVDLGERVIVGGHAGLEPGDEVRIMEAEAPDGQQSPTHHEAHADASGEE